jgi:integrase
VAALRQTGKAVKTLNAYLSVMKSFTKWLCRKMMPDPLAGMAMLTRQEADIRHERRALSLDEVDLLLEAAKMSKKTVHRRTGRERYFLYLTALATGLRASELRSMTRESFDLDSDPPTATVKGACTKNGQLANQPLRLDIVEELRPFLADKLAGEPVWPGAWTDRPWKLVKVDLAAARAKWLAGFPEGPERDTMAASDFLTYRDSAGCYADFHALRHTFITMVGKTGVTPKEHQDLARHSTYALTGRYTHSRLYDLATAVNALPSMLPKSPADERVAATGTDDSAPPILRHQGAKNGDFRRQIATQDESSKSSANRVKPKENERFSRSGADSANTAIGGSKPSAPIRSFCVDSQQVANSRKKPGFSGLF